METIEQRRAQSGGPNLVVLKAEILSALSSVATATTAEELRQANMAFERALHTARSKGYRPHIRATEGKQIQLEWVALDPRKGLIKPLVHFAECRPRPAPCANLRRHPIRPRTLIPYLSLTRHSRNCTVAS
jgi:hypothetical protein